MEFKQIKHTKLTSYFVGFFLSIILTLLAYFLTVQQTLKGFSLFSTLTLLAFLQAFVQLICFLYLGQEKKPRWSLMVFLFMALVALILVLGSLWIIYNLNYRVMSPMEMP